MQSIHKTKSKKNIFIYLVVILIVILINPFNIIGYLRNAVMIPLSPIVRLAFHSGSNTSEYLSAAFNIGNLYKENKDLIVKVRDLEVKNASLTDIKNENRLLREEMALLPKDAFNLSGAEIVRKDALGGDQWIVINKGLEHNVKLGSAVIVGEGALIGVIDEVDAKTARVKLLTHPDSSVNVVSTRSGAEAIAYGDHGLSIFIKDIKKDGDVQNGDMLITSNIGNSLPKGFSIGRVQNIRDSNDKLFHNAMVEPLVDLDTLKFVFVVQ